MITKVGHAKFVEWCRLADTLTRAAERVVKVRFSRGHSDSRVRRKKLATSV